MCRFSWQELSNCTTQIKISALNTKWLPFENINNLRKDANNTIDVFHIYQYIFLLLKLSEIPGKISWIKPYFCIREISAKFVDYRFNSYQLKGFSLFVFRNQYANICHWYSIRKYFTFRAFTLQIQFTVFSPKIIDIEKSNSTVKSLNLYFGEVGNGNGTYNSKRL